VHLLVPDSGRLTAIAKGARRSVRRFPGTLDLFNHLRVQVERRRSSGMARLEQATLIEAFTPLRRVPARFALGCYLLELLDRLAPEGGARADGRRLFGFALAALRTLATPRRIDARLRTLLELRALDALGLRPELCDCVRCGNSIQDGNAAEVAFTIADGGPVCSACLRDGEPLLRIHRGTLRALDQGLRFELEQLDRLVMSRQAVEESRRILDRFQRFHTGVELRSEPFLDEMLAVQSG
jgi:DNA repair protein RecO (recombination protein O)